MTLPLGGESRVIIEGENGTGKSSIIEALTYCCYLRSFRGAKPAEMVADTQVDASFFIKLTAERANGEPLQIQIGFAAGDKKVKINDSEISTYKEIMDHYRVVSVAAHDLALIQEGPEHRRTFIDNYILLQEPASAALLRTHKHIVSQRNELLVRGGKPAELQTWTHQLWSCAQELTALRERGLAALQLHCNQLYRTMIPGAKPLTLRYVRKHLQPGETFESFALRYQPIGLQERHLRRTLFGAHLDDIVLELGGRDVRLFASRGQQKLMLLLLKLAQIVHLQELLGSGDGLLLALDDIVTDFDPQVLRHILAFLETLECALVITTPVAGAITFSTPTFVLRLPVR